MPIPNLLLNSGHSIPALGLGTYKLSPGQTAEVVEQALRLGYRHIDTAALYGNEAEVGQGLKRSGVGREEIFVTTKLWNDAHRRDDARQAFRRSLSNLGLDYVDLYLIHWPVPANGLMVEAWQTLIELAEVGQALSIGVSNFRAEDLTTIIDATGVVPAVNQIELHPLFQQTELRALQADWGILTEAWGPLGRGADLGDATVRAVARETGRTAAQVVIRWMIQLDIACFPKTARPERLAENLAVDDFELDAKQMARLEGIVGSGRIGPDPAHLS
ncbi:MAG: aldo/keto reductase [Bifidobacteriaceae bacterium]|jgi:2,5-diketo-D-gluconate reductase A|nr:aldo/keto reductase [Bifidobacteriaceae bacterium]